MAKKQSEFIKSLVELQNTYDSYFQSLSEGEPKAPELPDISVETLSAEINAQFPPELEVTVEEMNQALDALKAGFAYIKLSKMLPEWAAGFKLTSVKDETPAE
jgi:hypothetical protein